MIKIDVHYKSGGTESLIMSDKEASEEIKKFLEGCSDDYIKKWMKKMKGYNEDISGDVQYGDGSWDLNK